MKSGIQGAGIKLGEVGINDVKSGIQGAGIKLEKVGINYVKLWIKDLCLNI